MSFAGSQSGQPISYYDVLQVQSGASDEDVKLAYHALAKKFHPDRNPADRRMAELRFRLINEAYASLKTREKRERYNRVLRQQRSRKAPPAPPRAENDNAQTPQVKSLFGALASILWPTQARGTETR